MTSATIVWPVSSDFRKAPLAMHEVKMNSAQRLLLLLLAMHHINRDNGKRKRPISYTG